jgi:iron complex outermembrane recepter protein
MKILLTQFIFQILLSVLFTTSILSETPPLSKNHGLYSKSSIKSEVSVTVSGIIRDEKGEPVAGANILVKGTSRGIQTFLDGKFQIETEAGNVLIITSIGYIRQEITVTGKDQTNITIVLKEDLSVLGGVTVVGTRFTKSRTDVDRPVPIDVISVKDIQQTGQIDLGQAIHYSAPSFNAYKFGINDAAPFVDPATLRGLGPDQVLVLVNNRRRHKVSFLSINDGVGKGQVGTDINIVPALSLKRIEVLRDGAAAQYGSDAIAGVINLQLNNASSGGTVATYIGNGYSKPNLDVKGIKAPVLVQDGFAYNLAANMGFKLGQKGFLNATATYSHTEGYDRSGSFSNPNATSSSNNFFSRTQSIEDSLIKARGITTLDRAILGSAENTTYGAFINAGMPINAKWDAYLFGGFTNKHVVTGVFTRSPSNAARSVLAIFPNGYNPIAPADLVDLSVTAGVKGTVGKDWALDLSLGHGSNKVDWHAENTVNPSLGATYNGRPAPTEFYVGQTYVNQTLFNADISKTFNSNAYPNYSIGFGTEVRLETFRQRAGDPASYIRGPEAGKDVGSSGREGFSNKTEGKWNRSNVGVYVETESEITKQFLFGAAIRGENYNDFGSDFSAKFNTLYKFADAFAIRGSVSRGFRAPSITQAHYSNYVNISFDNAGNSIPNPIIPSDGALAKALGITDGLKKETSLDFSGGITSKVGEHFTFTADVYQIDVKDRIQLSGGIKVAGIPAFVAEGYKGTANVFGNALDTRTRGLELVGNYNTNIGTGGKINVNIAFSSMHTAADTASFKKTSTGVTYIDAAAALYITDGQPRNKFIGSMAYDFKKLGFVLRATRFGAIKDPNAIKSIVPTDSKVEPFQTFGAKTLIDVSLNYRPIQKLLISLGVNNIADVYPDLLQIPQNANEVIFSRRTNQFGTQGRFWNASVQYNF